MTACSLILFKKKVQPTLWFSCNRLKIPPYPLVLWIGWILHVYLFWEKFLTRWLFWAVLSTYFVVLTTLKWPASLKLSLNSQIIAVLSFQVAQISFKHNWSLFIKKKNPNSMVNRNSMFIQFWKFFQATRLRKPPCLFDFGHFFLPTHY